MTSSFVSKSVIAALLAAGALCAADPYYSLRRGAELREKAVDLTTATARYKPMFGAGDDNSRIARALARFGELKVDPGGATETVSYDAEEQIYYVLDGTPTLLYGAEKRPLRRHDFVYLPVNVKRGVSNASAAPCRLLVMGFKIPKNVKPEPVPSLMMANAEEVKVVPTHGPGSLFRLLLGDRSSKRDKIAVANIVTSLFIMELAPGIDNLPHHHDTEEEVYYVLRGSGEIATGAGTSGEEGRIPAKAGDACFFRLNATVGFFRDKNSAENPQILAVRFLYPFRQPESK